MVKTKRKNRNESRHFIIDEASGQIQFGDGVKGTIPSTCRKGSASFRRIKDEKNIPKVEDVKCESPPSFKRNNYFYGKIMTENDFRAEQQYFINKQRLLNRLIHGIGVVCGLEVLKLEESQIRITEGVALDFCGREIVVPKCVNMDLNEKLTLREDERDAYVWIKYDYCGEEPIHTVAGCEEEVRYSRIKESYKIDVGWDLPKYTAKKDEFNKMKCSKFDEDQAIILARVHVRKKDGTIVISEVDNEVIHRKLVYSNKHLYELIKCLKNKIDVISRQRIKCPYCEKEFEVVPILKTVENSR